ncbi:MAG: EF-hand domain-containing protein [Gemmataceae bacterium]|nr:EF-hand domain-containing protein [Gemmataceae bacterium]
MAAVAQDHFTLTAMALTLLIACGGCAGDRVAAPSLSPEDAAQSALAEYDTNKDGYLDGEELNRCPALKNSLALIDKDGDGRLSADEIAQRIRAYRDTKVGLTAIVCEVTLDGDPLNEASVTFVPEKFLGSGFQAGSGMTEATGIAILTVAGRELPGLPYGFYRIVVSKKNADGQETIPVQYNVETVLGQEVGPRVPTLRGKLRLALESK